MNLCCKQKQGEIFARKGREGRNSLEGTFEKKNANVTNAISKLIYTPNFKKVYTPGEKG